MKFTRLLDITSGEISDVVKSVFGDMLVSIRDVVKSVFDERHHPVIAHWSSQWMPASSFSFCISGSRRSDL